MSYEIQVKLNSDRVREPWDKANIMPRFLSKIEKNGTCWVWKACIDKLGYGRLRIGGRKGRAFEAHIVAYRLFVGDIPEGLELDHLCRNRACVNPDHLEPVTHSENMKRGAHAIKTSCIRGHAFTEENTAVYKNRRNCKACEKARREERRGNHVLRTES